jgi:hypothetical protein
MDESMLININKAPSYEELKDSESFWLQVTPYIAGMCESFDGDLEEMAFSSFVYYESDDLIVEDACGFPFRELRIDISERSTEEISRLSGKYPVGFFRFEEDSASVTLICRSEMVSRMIATLSLVKYGEVEFLIALPKLPSNLPNVYPVLNFQFRVRSSRDSKTP